MNEYLTQLMDMDRQWSKMIHIKERRVADTSLTNEQRHRCLRDLEGLLAEKADMQQELEELSEPILNQINQLLCQPRK